MSNIDTFYTEAVPDKIIYGLKKFGLAIIPNHISSVVLASLTDEFMRALECDNTSIRQQPVRHPLNPLGMVATLRTNDATVSRDFPVISEVFHSELMRQIAHDYYSPNSYSFNEAIFITNEFESEVNILPWHFDRIQSLKFWLNLTDTTSDNGAFEYCPGTHWQGRYRAGFHMSQGCPVVDIPNDIDEDLIFDPVCIELKAGDLLIFDADGFHRGGVVQPGNERRVLRAHTHPTGRRYGDRIFSRGWWVSSPLNINRWFKSSTTRVLGDKIQETTINRSQSDISKKKNLDD